MAHVKIRKSLIPKCVEYLVADRTLILDADRLDEISRSGRRSYRCALKEVGRGALLEHRYPTSGTQRERVQATRISTLRLSGRIRSSSRDGLPPDVVPGQIDAIPIQWRQSPETLIVDSDATLAKVIPGLIVPTLE
jgi:hypothetical protein